MKQFLLHWKDGKTQVVSGDNIAHACKNAGIGHGALPALDYYEPITRPTLRAVDAAPQKWRAVLYIYGFDTEKEATNMAEFLKMLLEISNKQPTSCAAQPYMQATGGPRVEENSSESQAASA